MKKVLIVFVTIVTIVFSFLAVSADGDLRDTLRGAEQRLTGEDVKVSGDEAKTEAGAGCMTPECLAVDEDSLGSPDVEIAEMCRATLPTHCQQIKDIKLTACYDDQVDLFTGAGGASVLSCSLGVWEGIVDVASTVLNIGTGAWNFAFDSEYREEALNAASFFFEQFSDSEKIKALLSDPILEDLDQWVECLNYKGRWEYVCEGGIQLIGSLFAYDMFISLPKWKLKTLIGRRGNRQKLSVAEKYRQRKDLQERLNTSGGTDIGGLSPYQLSRLKLEDIPKLNVSNLTDDIADLLSPRQLEAIPLSKIRQMRVANNSRTLSRLSDDQFRAVAASQDMSGMPFYAIEENIKRIRSVDIEKLNNLDRISPAAFGQMSAAQIRGMSHRQVNNVTPEQEGALDGRLKEALEDTRKTRKTEENKRKREEKKEQEAQEERRRQEEQEAQRQQQSQEGQPKDDKNESGEQQQSQEGQPKDDKNESGEQQQEGQPQKPDDKPEDQSSPRDDNK